VSGAERSRFEQWRATYGPYLFRIGLLLVLLVMLLVLRGPCSQGVASFFDNFAPPVDAGARD
jgi:hypothetical protein